MSEHKLKAAFAEVLGVGPQTDWRSVSYRSTAAWDSVAHMQLVAAIESSFEVMLETEEVIDLSSFDKAQEILARHGVQF